MAKNKKEAKQRQFTKDMRFLWIYSVVFCVVVVALIVGAALIQIKTRNKLNEYQDELEYQQSSNTENKSALKNIQDKYDAAAAENERLKDQNKALEQRASDGESLIIDANSMLDNQERLVVAMGLYIKGKRTAAREQFEKINPDDLPVTAQEQYNDLKKTLGL